MMKLFKLVAARILVLAVLIFIAAALILYQAGKYDISFIPRETKAADTTANGKPHSEEISSATETQMPVTGDNISSVTDPETLVGIETTRREETTADEKTALLNAYNSFIESCGKYEELTSAGYTETGAAFDSSVHKLAIVTPKIKYQNIYSYRKEIEEYTDRVATSLGYETQYKTREVYRPTVKLYMGLVVYDDGDGQYTVYDRWGNLIADNINPFYTVYDRDENGNPLVRYGSKYYAIRPDGVFAETPYDPDYSPGVLFDAPEYYAKSNIKLYPYSQERVVYVMIEIDERRNETVTVLSNVPADEFDEAKQVMAEKPPAETSAPETKPADTTPLIDPLTGKPVPQQTAEPEPVTEAEIIPETEAQTEPVENPPVFEYRREKLWGFKDEKGRVAIDAQYKAVYTFSDNGLAAVVGYNGELKFIDTSGITIINPYGKILYLPEFDNRRSYDGFYPADTKLPENLGMYYFDHGLVRVRRQIKDNYFRKRVAIDRDYLIDKNGAYFDIPENYRLVAYSDGVLTLEKDGYYGYYSYRGYWIAQPIYTVCKPFVQGLGVIGFTGGKCAMIDTEGNVVIPFVFDYISQPSAGVIAAYSKHGGWTEFVTMAKPA
jgi:hypothetical protein